MTRRRLRLRQGAWWIGIAALGMPGRAVGQQDPELTAALAADRAETAAHAAPEEPAEPRARSASLQSLNPDLTVILDVAGALFSRDAHMQSGGHDPSVDGFNLQQVELAIGSAVDPYFRLDGNIVFSLDGVELEEFYATTLGLGGGFQIRAGQFLTKLGRINATHLHTWDFVDQPFAIGRLFGAEGNRGLGAEVSWLTPLPWYVELSLSSIMADDEETARSFFNEQRGGVDGFQDLEYVAALKQFFALDDDWSLNWGLSGAFGPSAAGGDKRAEIFGTDIYLKWRPIHRASHAHLALQTEWFYRKRQGTGHAIWDVSGYASLVWRMAKRWTVGGRYELGSPAGDFSGNVANDPLDPEWTDRRHRVTNQITFVPSEFSRIRLQGSVDLPEWLSKPTYAGFLAAEFSVGAHGAHPF